jgi:type IV pilus assembly protein PilQ
LEAAVGLPTRVFHPAGDINGRTDAGLEGVAESAEPGEMPRTSGSTRPGSDRSLRSDQSGLAGRGQSCTGQSAQSDGGQTQSERRQTAEQNPEGPIAAVPYPLQAQQVQSPPSQAEPTQVPPPPAPDDPEKLKKAVEAIRPYLARAKASSGPAPAVPRGPAPAAREVVPAGQPVGEGAPRVAKIEAEGDGRLSISFKNEDIRNVLEMFSAQGNLNILASNSVQGTVSATLNSVDLDGALQAILHSTGYVSKREGRFIYVGTTQDFATMEQSLDQVGTRVYRPNYVAAADLQALIQPLLTKDHGVVSVSKPSEIGIPTETDKAGGDHFAGNEVVLVRDYEAVLSQVDQVVAETDVRPTQVSIESMILSVKLTDTDSFGINWQALQSNPHVALALGSPGSSLPTDFSSGGLTFAYLNGNLGAFLTALETLNETNVIATPRLMVMNKQRAEVQIGHSTGYVSATTQTETSTSSQMQTLDTGTILRLRPFISSDGMVRMEVHPELSSGQVIVMGQTLVPDKDITQVTTNVMVRDGCTVIIGGLIQQELGTTGNQIPFLGNLKYIGPLFRNRTETTTRNEILILLTPRIVCAPDADREGRQAACESQRRQGVYADKMSPLGKRSVSRRYLRMAQNAQAEGQPGRALRFAELAVQFDPLSLEAIELRNQLCQNGKVCPGGTGPQGQPPADPAALDQQVLAPWLLNDLERQPPAPPAVQHPLDPGQPGPQKDIICPRRLQ